MVGRPVAHSIPDDMPTTLSPIESEFATVEEAEAYDRWFRAKVQASLADTRPNVPHDQVMADMESIIRAAEIKRAARRS
ncbi:hypothetical protein SAMN02787149_1371 [Pseudomonas sp. Snoq117.2]|nr:hypothetical protein SAMN02787149_1371 [Pseudomonas sp. Snoq117.2]